MRMRAALIALLLACGCQPPPAKEDPARDAAFATAAESRFDERDLLRSLERIRAWHLKNNPKVAAALRPGLTDEEFDRKTGSLPFRLPRELRVLYRWRDGLPPGVPFVEYHEFASLDDAVAAYRGHQYRWYWRRYWFPVFEFQGEHYFVACDGAERKAAPIRYYGLQETEHWVSYANLGAMMRTYADAMESGAIRAARPDLGLMESDVRKLSAIHRRLNPGATFPYYVPPPR